MGGDSLASLDRWHQPQRIARMATLAAVRRGGQAPLSYDALPTIIGEQAARAGSRCRDSNADD